VNNAGVTGGDFDDHLEETSTEKFRTLTEVNVHGTFYATRASLPYLRDSQGTVVFIGSSAGKLPRPGAPVYAASKWWTRGFAHSVEAHAGQDGVAVSLINPTAVRTDVWRDKLDEGQAAEPEEVATLVVTAASQPNHSTLSEVDLFRRDMLGKFIPAELDLDLSYDLSGGNDL
jgi:NADP-dependent 3-hydroxy acid dehydrogenase YdfG